MIEALFSRVERTHGRVLVARTLAYLTLGTAGFLPLQLGVEGLFRLDLVGNRQGTNINFTKCQNWLFEGELFTSDLWCSGRSGMSENELEDILSCDDVVLNDVYQYWVPPIRRLPPLLLVRIKTDLRQYLGE